MLFTVVFCAFSIICEVRGGYIYSRPSIAFDLPTHQPSLHHHEKYQTQNAFLSSGNTANSVQQNRITSTYQDLTSLEPMTPEFNANIDSSISDGHKSDFNEQNHINVEQILDIENGAQFLRNQQNTESPEAFNTFRTQDMVSAVKLHDYVHSSRGCMKLAITPPPYQTQYNQRALQTVDVRRPSVKPVLNLQQALSVQNNIGGQFSAPQISYNSPPVSNINLGLVSSVENNVLIQSNKEENISKQYFNVQNVAPVVTKQVSFHVPPEDDDFSEQVIYQQPKKVYKIIFIKLPSQEVRNKSQLQFSSNSLSSIEDKTIIYVLSKKPETVKLDLAKPKPSEHEVFFVKYKDNSKSILQENI